LIPRQSAKISEHSSSIEAAITHEVLENNRLSEQDRFMYDRNVANITRIRQLAGRRSF
jgi:hypothetical protein